jgi:hypothetical protein
MDTETIYALSYSFLIIAVVGGLLFSVRPPGPPSVPGPSPIPTLETVSKYGRIIGIGIPYVLFAIGPLIDIYNREFRYSNLTLTGVAAMGIGYALQRAVHGPNAYLSSLTVATAAILTFWVHDVWINTSAYNYQLLTTVLGALILALQAIHGSSGPVFATALLNAGVAAAMGVGIGAFGWEVVWNLYRNRLPNYAIAIEAKKK